jgi:hypothetical protein
VVQPVPAEKTRSLNRFAAQAEPGQPATLTVVEDKSLREELALTSLDPKLLELYLHTTVASPALKKALQDAFDRKTAVAKAQAKCLAIERQISELIDEQDRVRRNLQGLTDVRSKDPFGDPIQKPTGELRERYINKFSTLETELEQLRTNFKSFKQEETRLTRDWETFLETLVVE